MYLSSSLEKLQLRPLSFSSVRRCRREKDFSNSFMRNASNSLGTQFLTRSSLIQSMASEPRFPECSVISSTLSQPRLAKWKIVSKMAGVIKLERGIQLNRWAKHFKASTHTLSAAESRGANGTLTGNKGDALGGVPNTWACRGVPKLGGEIPKGEGLPEWGCVSGEPVKCVKGDPDRWGFLIGDTLGEGGGVVVVMWRCFSAIFSSSCISNDNIVGTCCCIRCESSSFLWEERYSQEMFISSSEAVNKNARPRDDVLSLRTNCVSVSVCGGGCGEEWWQQSTSKKKNNSIEYTYIWIISCHYLHKLHWTPPPTPTHITLRSTPIPLHMCISYYAPPPSPHTNAHITLHSIPIPPHHTPPPSPPHTCAYHTTLHPHPSHTNAHITLRFTPIPPHTNAHITLRFTPIPPHFHTHTPARYQRRTRDTHAASRHGPWEQSVWSACF